MRIRLSHLSMQYSDNVKQKTHDARIAFTRNRDWVTGTEAGEEPLRRVLRSAARRHGYWIHFWRGNWVAVRKDIVKPNTWKVGGFKIVDASATFGPGHDLGLCWVSFVDRRKLGRITVGCTHYATKGTTASKDPGRRVNLRHNKKVARKISRWGAQAGKGGNLVFLHGDANTVDKYADIFHGAKTFITCWDEVREWDNTGHGNIDFIARGRRDARVTCVGAEAHTDREMHLFTDHFMVDANYDVEPKAA